MPRRKPVPTSPEVDSSMRPVSMSNTRINLFPPQIDVTTELPLTPPWQQRNPTVGKNTPIDATRMVPDYSPPGSVNNYLLQTDLRTAKWGIHWLKEPLAMPLFALVGLGLAIGHHFYFSYLDGNLVPGAGVSSQQIVKQVGNAFVFLALACFRASIVIAYNQYIWTIFRRNSLKVSIIDKVFSLPSRLLSFFSFQLLGQAPLALVLGAVPW